MKINREKSIYLFQKLSFILLLSIIFISCGKHNLDLTEGGKIATLNITSSIQSGKYSSPPSFDLTLSKYTASSEISYCINAGVYNSNYCCDPLSEGVNEKASFVSGTAGTTDGKYCLSYVGYTDEEVSQVGQILFEIDTSAPDIFINTQRRMVQSSQYIDISFNSSTIRDKGYFFSALNYPSSQAADCDAINSSANFTTNGIDLDNDGSPDTLDMELYNGTFSQTLRGKDLANFGDNFLYFALVDAATEPMLASCPGINIILNDFNVFEFSSNGDMVANGSGEFEAVGSFNSFGGGVSIGNTGATKLQTGLVNIIH